MRSAKFKPPAHSPLNISSSQNQSRASQKPVVSLPRRTPCLAIAFSFRLRHSMASLATLRLGSAPPLQTVSTVCRRSPNTTSCLPYAILRAYYITSPTSFLQWNPLATCASPRHRDSSFISRRARVALSLVPRNYSFNASFLIRLTPFHFRLHRLAHELENRLTASHPPSRFSFAHQKQCSPKPTLGTRLTHLAVASVISAQPCDYLRDKQVIAASS